MDNAFANPFELNVYYEAEAICHNFFGQVRFRNGDYCPFCGFTEIYRFGDGKRYRCAMCKKDFTIRTRTAFGGSKIPLRKWFIAIYLLTVCRKGISSVQFAKQIGVTQKTAQLMDHRIRKAMKHSNSQICGTVEVNESYVGGKGRDKHQNIRATAVRTRGFTGRFSTDERAFPGTFANMVWSTRGSRPLSYKALIQ